MVSYALQEKHIACNVYGVSYECAGYPQTFYLYTLIIAAFLLVGYLLCNFYGLLWLFCPCFGTISTIMDR